MDPWTDIKLNTELPWAGSCALSARKEGLALRGILFLLLAPLVFWVIWKKRRR